MDTTNKTNDINNDCNLKIEIKGFFKNDISITDAKVYEVELKDNLNFNYLSNIITSLNKLKKNDDKDILINDFSMKNTYIARKYLQQNCLILTKNSLFFDENLSVEDNIKVVSYMFTGFDLSQATASSFNIKDVIKTKVKDLSSENKKLLLLSYCVACPEIIWFVDYKLLEDLSKEGLELFQNAVKIRVKHGGVVFIVK